MKKTIQLKMDIRRYMFTGSDQETQDFIGYHSTLINAGLAGHDIYSLDSAELATVLSFGDSSTSITRLAEGADYLVNGNYYPLQPEVISGGSQRIINVQNGGLTNQISVSPNPFNEIVHFNLGPGDDERPKTVKVMNVQGVLLWVHATTDTQVEWNPKNLPVGMYFYTVTMDGKILNSGKLYYIK